jgi:hypothetical protein
MAVSPVSSLLEMFKAGLGSDHASFSKGVLQQQKQKWQCRGSGKRLNQPQNNTAYFELLLLWNETKLVMTYNLFNVLLDSVCKYFTEGFCLCSLGKLVYSFPLLLCPYLVLVSG